MDQHSLYETARKCGAKVIVFTDYPAFFSSWSIRVMKGGNSYLIEGDGRDCWVSLYIALEANKFEEKDRLNSQSLSESDILSQCEAWLSNLP